MSITSKPFGQEQHGLPVTEYTLTNAQGAYVSILDFGGIITNIVVPDRNGVLGDVNLGFTDAGRYTSDTGSMGALIGRVGNRIAGAAFELEGTSYTLAANNGCNNLHGGPEGFSLRLWRAEPFTGPEGDSLRLTLVSPDGDQGFPGTLTAEVTYTFDAHNKLGIRYLATTDRTTIVNMTNHAYFNLDGLDAPDVRDLELQVFAEYVTEARPDLVPTGRLIPQKELAFSFASPRRVGDVLALTDTDPAMKAAGGVDFNYAAGGDRVAKHIATLYSPKTGREMQVHTDMPGVQVYTGQGLHQPGKGGVTYHAYSGMCLETQRYPDAVHQPYFPSFVLRPQETYYTWTEYRFGVR